jgi:type I restriction enzyme S subunit
MGKWPLVRLGEIVEIKKGTKIEPCDRSNGNIRYIQIEDLRSNNNIKYCSENEKYVLANEDDLIIAWDGANAGTIGYGLSGAIGSTLALMRISQKGIFDVRYLGEYLKGKFNYLQQNCTGATIPHIDRLTLENIRVPVPPIIIQERIANALDKAREIIDSYKEQLAELDNLIKAVFYEMFGDPVLNEKGWDVKPLQKCAEIVSGVTKGRDLTGKEVVNVPYLRVANVQDGYIDISDIKTIDVLPEDKVKYKLQRGDILLTEGGDPDKLGRGSVWYEEIPDCIHQNHIFRVRVDKDILNPEYVSKLIGSDYGKRYFLKSAKQTTGIATINSKQLKEFLVLCPPLDLQTKFANIVTKIEEQKALVKQAIAESEHLFKSLMSEYFD